MERLASEIAISWRHYALVFVLSYIAWMLLAGTLAAQEFVLGALVALAVTAVTSKHIQVFAGIRFELAAPGHFVLFLAAFFKALILANIDMARRVLTPSLPIRPDLVEIETQLRSPLGKLLLTSAITLTPGTLSVDVKEDRVYVHWVYCPPDLDMKAKTQAIAGTFERHLRGFVL